MKLNPFYFFSLFFVGVMFIVSCEKDEAITALNQYDTNENIFEGSWQTKDGSQAMSMITNTETNFISFEYTKVGNIALKGDTFYYDDISSEQFIRCFVYRFDDPNISFDVRDLSPDSFVVFNQRFTEIFDTPATFYKQ